MSRQYEPLRERDDIPMQPLGGTGSHSSELSGEHSGEVDAAEELKYGAKAVTSLMAPVSLCLLVVVATVRSVSYFSTNPEHIYLPYASVFSEKQASTGMAILSAVGNALIVIGVIVVMTFLLVCLFKCRCYKAIHGWLVFSNVMLLFVFGFVYFQQLMMRLNIAMDWVTTAVVMWNFGIVGILAIFWRAPLRLTQGYLILASALMALTFLKRLPPFTTWALLGLIAIYDLIAVLCPGGPLKMLVEAAQERNEPLLPSLVYSSTVVYTIGMAAPPGDHVDDDMHGSNTNLAHDADDNAQLLRPESSSVSQQPQREGPEEEPEDEGVKLGLGDFIFYSVLVGKAAEERQWGTVVACVYAVLAGLCLTLAILAIVRKALPALPISIFLGLLMFFTTDIIMNPLTEMLGCNLLFV